MSETNINFCFPVYLEKLEKGANLLESKTMIIGRGAAEIWSLRIFLMPISSSKIWPCGYPLKYSPLKMCIFMNFGNDLYFQDHLLQELTYMFNVRHLKR